MIAYSTLAVSHANIFPSPPPMSSRSSLVSFVNGLVVLFFLWGFSWGFISGAYESFPHDWADGIVRSLRHLLVERDHRLYEARFERSGARLEAPSKRAPGVTLVTSAWGDEGRLRPEIRLLDTGGEVLHRWRVRPSAIWPKSPHDDWARGTKNVPTNYVHGTHLLEDGDVLFNIEYLGLVRMDACGDVEWKLPYRTHHAVSRGFEGDYWVLGQTWIESSETPPIEALDTPVAEDTVLRVSPEGEILREISVIEVLKEAGLQELLVKYHRLRDDLLHTNDVEVLSPRLADAFESMEAGDVMISMRTIDTVLVFEPDSRDVVFHAHAPLLGQHDPDFLPSGRISIFDNRRCLAHHSCDEWGENYGGSEIVSTDPDQPGDWKVLYEGTRDRPFYTRHGGKHQHLSNGNLLVTESGAGRVFEVDDDGELVWEWIHEPWRDGRVPEVLEGTRYPELSPEDVEAGEGR